jgi:YegS/Rv2252/BmrU family lipid kinase
MAPRALLIVNTHSRCGQDACEASIAGLRRNGIEPVYRDCRRKEELLPLIAEHGRAVDMIVAAGGDGTLNAVAAGVMQAKRPLGILPTGTANDLARTLGIPLDLEGAIRVIAEGNRRAIDVGTVNGKPFFNVASIGMAAELALKLSPDIKRRFGKLGYALAAIRVLARARPFRTRIIGGGRDVFSLTLQIAVGNGRFYGGGNAVSHTAAINDGMLDLYSLEFLRAWRLVLMLRSFRRGEHIARREVRDLRGTRFEIHTRQPRPVDADGEIVTHTPAVFEVLPEAIEVIVPTLIVAPPGSSRDANVARATARPDGRPP